MQISRFWNLVSSTEICVIFGHFKQQLEDCNQAHTEELQQRGNELRDLKEERCGIVEKEIEHGSAPVREASAAQLALLERVIEEKDRELKNRGEEMAQLQGLGSQVQACTSQIAASQQKMEEMSTEIEKRGDEIDVLKQERASAVKAVARHQRHSG